MFQDPALETAYREGRKAAQAGRDNNPYEPESPCFFAWQIGSNQVEQESRDAEEGELMCPKKH